MSEPSDKTPAQNTTAQQTVETPPTEPEKTESPQGTTTPAALFDLTSPAEKKQLEKDKKEREAKERAEKTRAEYAKKNPAGAANSQPKTPPAPPTVYKAGTTVRYLGHSLTLEKNMTAEETLAWISEDDFPELAHEEVEMRYDKDKNRLVPVRRAQKKGL